MQRSDALSLPSLRRRLAGHTLAELAVVIALLSVLAAIGWSSARGQLGQFRLMSGARLFQSDAQNLRALAIAENREGRILLLESDADMNPAEPQIGMWLLQIGDKSNGSTEWDTLPVDLNGVAVSDQGERSLDEGGNEERYGISLAPWPTIAGPGIGNQDAIVFSPRGFISNPVSDFVDGYISVELVNKRGEMAEDGTFPHVYLRVARGGLVHLEASESTALASGTVGAGGTTTP